MHTFTQEYPYSVRETDEGKFEAYFPMHSGQKRAMASKARITLVLAGSQSGKTSWAAWWLLREIRDCGPGVYLYASPTHPLLAAQPIPSVRALFEDMMRLGTYKEQKNVFEFSTDGSRRLFGEPAKCHIKFGHASKPDSLESMTAKAAVLDECGQDTFKVGSFEAIERRLLRHEGRMLLCSTPYNLGWLKKRIYDNRDSDDIECIQFASIENPVVTPEAVERARRDMQPWRFRMMYLGEFTRPAGQIYDCFDREEHVIERRPIPPEWKRYVGVDFGGANTACIYLAEEQTPSGKVTGRYYAYRTYNSGGKTVAQHVEDIMDKPRTHTQIRESDGVEDIDAEPRTPQGWGGALSEEDRRREWNDKGMRLRKPRVKDVEVQISAVYSLMANGKLLIFDDLVSLIEDIENYSRETDDEGLPGEKILNKSAYHTLDALRYVATGLSRNTVDLKHVQVAL